MSSIQYRVRPVTRFIVTRYEKSERGGSCVQKGEFPNLDLATEVAQALAVPEDAECVYTQPKENDHGPE